LSLVTVLLIFLDFFSTQPESSSPATRPSAPDFAACHIFVAARREAATLNPKKFNDAAQRLLLAPVETVV
jgi:hypothetical protein